MAAVANSVTYTLQPVCQNCSTSTTPLWRRDESGSVLCNACGLFLKLHGRPRPISLKTDIIKSRNRVKATAQGPRKKVNFIFHKAQQTSSMLTSPRRRLRRMAFLQHTPMRPRWTQRCDGRPRISRRPYPTDQSHRFREQAPLAWATRTLLLNTSSTALLSTVTLPSTRPPFPSILIAPPLLPHPPSTARTLSHRQRTRHTRLSRRA